MSSKEIVHADQVIPGSGAALSLPSEGEWKHYLTMAENMAYSSLVPDRLRGKPKDLVIVLLVARDLGLSAITAMTQITVIDGQPGLSAMLMRSIVKNAGHEIWIEPESDARSATVSGKRRGSDRVESATFTIEEAAQAGLCELLPDGSVQALSNKGNPMPWQQYTADMLVARASSRLCRRVFEDVLVGYGYTGEEVGAIDRPNPELIQTPVLPDERTGDEGYPDWVRRVLTTCSEEALHEAMRPRWKGSPETFPATLAEIPWDRVPMDVAVQIAQQMTGGGTYVPDTEVAEEAGTKEATQPMPAGCPAHPDLAEPDTCSDCYEIVFVPEGERTLGPAAVDAEEVAAATLPV